MRSSAVDPYGDLCRLFWWWRNVRLPDRALMLRIRAEKKLLLAAGVPVREVAKLCSCLKRRADVPGCACLRCSPLASRVGARHSLVFRSAP